MLTPAKRLSFDGWENCVILKKLSITRLSACWFGVEEWREGGADREEPEVRFSEQDSRPLELDRIGSATLATLAGYADRNFETESAVPWSLGGMRGLKARSVTVAGSRLSREV